MQRNSTIGELMERKRIQDGAKEYQGHTYMDLARFDKRNEFNIEQFLSRRLKLKAGDEFVVVDAD